MVVKAFKSNAKNQKNGKIFSKLQKKKKTILCYNALNTFLMYKIPITQFNFKDFKEKIYEKNLFTLSLS
ncbi:hypothetical protein EWZ72_03580, partial [Helicobacter pylori]|nr:hypothetical protein [Helicobacter pylori]